MKLLPRYIGKGANFYLVVCDHVVRQGTPMKVAQERVQRSCQRCGFWRDAFKRAREAEKSGKSWRKLVCVHPFDKAALDKWKPHITDWGK